jgi:hypothetical protein
MNIKLLYLLAFIVAIFFDILIKNNYLGNSIKYLYFKFTNFKFISMFLYLFVIFFFLLYLLDFSSIINIFDNIFYNDIYNNMVNDNNNNSIQSSNNENNNLIKNINIDTKLQGEIGKNSNINLNTPRFNLNFNKESLNNFAAAGSVAGGASAGIKVAQYFGGTPTTKLALGLATLASTQLATTIMSKVLNSNNIDNNNTKNTNNFIPNIFDTTSNKELNSIFDKYPFNLLTDLDAIINIEILLIFILFNLFVASYISNLNHSKYIPDNTFGKFIKIILNKYINIWTISRKYILIYT